MWKIFIIIILELYKINKFVICIIILNVVVFDVYNICMEGYMLI